MATAAPAAIFRSAALSAALALAACSSAPDPSLAAAKSKPAHATGNDPAAPDGQSTANGSTNTSGTPAAQAAMDAMNEKLLQLAKSLP